MHGLSILPAAAQDAEGIAHVLRQAWLETYPNEKYKIIPEDIEHFSRTWTSEGEIEHRRQQLATLAGDRSVFVAHHQGTVIGQCVIWRYDSHNEVCGMYVMPAFHRQGVGTALWRRACQACTATKETRVWVAAYNDKAINFYKKFAFTPTGRNIQQQRFKMPSGAIIPEIEMIRKAQPCAPF